MRYQEGHKDLTRQHILDVAGRKFRKEGLVAVGLAGLMKEAGLTNGAFYAHFKSKDDLIKSVLIDVLDKRSDWFADQISKGETLEVFIKSYLSPHHRDTPEEGCASAALVSEIIQHSKALRTVYSKKLEISLAQIAELLPGSPAAKSEKAIAVFSTALGCLQLARAVTDEKLSDKILKCGREAVLAMIS